MEGDEKDQEKERVVVMDTPERAQIANPLSKFEDSPVFNYINNLSPIKPVKSVHFTQTFSSLSFASLPSIFTSPHVSSLKDSRFLRRHQFSDPSKPELTSEDAKKAEISEGNLNSAQNQLNQQQDFDSGNSITETSVVPSISCSNRESRNLSYEVVSPNMMNRLKIDGQMRIESEIEGSDPLLNKEVTACDWESLISDASELLNFDSPGDTVPGQSTVDDDPSEKHEGLNVAAENHQTFANTSLNNLEIGEPVEDTDNEVGSNLYRGMRRRCLVFPLNVSESNETVLPNDNRLLLPGIGLHLNALASNLVDQKVVKHETSGSGGQLIISPPSAAFHSMISAQESISIGATLEPAQDGAPIAEDASRALVLD